MWIPFVSTLVFFLVAICFIWNVLFGSNTWTNGFASFLLCQWKNTFHNRTMLAHFRLCFFVELIGAATYVYLLCRLWFSMIRILRWKVSELAKIYMIIFLLDRNEVSFSIENCCWKLDCSVISTYYSLVTSLLRSIKILDKPPSLLRGICFRLNFGNILPGPFVISEFE